MGEPRADGTWVTIGGARILLGSPAHKALLKRVQQRRQGVKDTARGMAAEAESYVQAACLVLLEAGCTEVTPPGFEPVVKALKAKKGVENPWAVAWSMKNRGAKTEAKKKEALAFAADCFDQAARLVEAVEDAEAGTSAGAKAGWERRKRGGDPKPAATPEQIGAERREFAKRSKASRLGRPSKQKMDVGGPVSARTERQRRIKALDKHFAKKYSDIGGAPKPRRSIGRDRAEQTRNQAPAPAAAPSVRDLYFDPTEQRMKRMPSHMSSEAMAREVLADIDRFLETLGGTDEAGTSAGAKAGWEKRKGGGGPAAQPEVLPGGQMVRHRSSESAQPVRATLVIREAAGMSSLPQLGRAGTRVPGRPGSGLVRKDNGAVERVPVQKGSFHDDLRRKTSLRRVMHKQQPKVGAA